MIWIEVALWLAALFMFVLSNKRKIRSSWVEIDYLAFGLIVGFGIVLAVLAL